MDYRSTLVFLLWTVHFCGAGYSERIFLAHALGYGVGAYGAHLRQEEQASQQVRALSAEKEALFQEAGPDETLFIERVVKKRMGHIPQELAIKKVSVANPLGYGLCNDTILLVPDSPLHVVFQGGQSEAQKAPVTIEKLGSADCLHASLASALRAKRNIAAVRHRVGNAKDVRAAWDKVNACLQLHAAIIVHELGHYRYAHNYAHYGNRAHWGASLVGAGVYASLFGRSGYFCSSAFLKAAAIGWCMHKGLDWLKGVGQEFFADEYVVDPRHIQCRYQYFVQRDCLRKRMTCPTIAAVCERHGLWSLYDLVLDPDHPPALVRAERYKNRLSRLSRNDLKGVDT